MAKRNRDRFGRVRQGLETLESRVLMSGNGVIDVTQGLPDLQVTISPSFNVPANILSGTGQVINLPIQIMNLNETTADGKTVAVPAGESAAVSVVARPAGALSNSQDIAVGSISSVVLGGLQVGGTQNLVVPVTLPNTVGGGNWLLVVTLDPDSTLLELGQDPANPTVQANNIAQTAPFPITQGRPDLVVTISDHSLPASTTSASGKIYSIPLVITNNGTLPVPANTTTTVQATLVSELSGLNHDFTSITVNVGGLKPHASVDAVAMVTFNNFVNDYPASLVDHEVFTFTVDPDGSIDELSQGNNTAVTKVVLVTLGAPFLQISSTPNPKLPTTAVLSGGGQTIKATVKVTNTGNGPWSPTATSADMVTLVAVEKGVNVDTAADDQIYEVSEETQLALANIAAGKSANLTLSGTLPINMPSGDYQLYVRSRFPDITGTSQVTYALAASQAITVLNGFVNLQVAVDPSAVMPQSTVSGNGSVFNLPLDIKNLGNLSTLKGAQIGVTLTLVMPNNPGFTPIPIGASDDVPVAVATGDFNGDGKADMVVVNSNTDTVSVLLNKGNGAFATKVDYAAGNDPVAVAVGDFNGDGKMDIAVVDAGDDSVSVLLNKGNGTFAAGTEYAVGSDPVAIAVGDFDGDGKLDIAVANQGDNTVSILLNNNNKGFAGGVAYPVGHNPVAIAAADLNGDGKADLAVVNQGDGTVSVLLNNGNGTFGLKVDYAVGSNPVAIVAADFSGDGKPDLAVVNEGDDTVSLLVNNSNGTFAAKVDFAVGNDPVAVAAADFNGDGKLDLVVANQQDNTVSVLLNNGSGSFVAQVDYATQTGPTSVAVGDFNGDGKIDLAATTTAGSVSVLINSGDGAFSAPENFSSEGTPLSIGVIKAGGTEHITVKYSLAAGVGFDATQADQFAIVATLVDTDNVHELITSDNSSTPSKPLGVILGDPDLSVSTPANLKMPATVLDGMGKVFNIPAIIKNVGTLATPAGTLTSIEVMAADATGDPAVKVAELDDVDLSGINPGSSKTITVPVTLLGTLASGSYTFSVVVDPDGQVTELSKVNNTTTINTPVAVTQGLVDLAASIDSTGLNGANVNAGDGSKLVLPLTIENLGNIAAAKGQLIDVRVYAVDQTTGTPTNIATISGVNIGGLKVNAQKTFKLSVTLPIAMTDGSYQIFAEVDSGLVVPEPGDTVNANGPNNTAAGPVVNVTQIGPNLTVTFPPTLNLPLTAVSGDGSKIALPLTITNNGDIAVPRGLKITVEIQAHNQADGDDTDNDILLMELTSLNLGGLAPGASGNFSVNITLPAGMESGDYVLVVTVDSTNVLPELNEGDNVGTTGPLSVTTP